MSGLSRRSRARAVLRLSRHLWEGSVMSRSAVWAAACAAVVAASGVASGQVVINEFQYDDGGTDDREFVKLYNASGAPVELGGLSLLSRDQPGTSFNIALPTFTLNPGAYYVIGQAGVPNVNLTQGAFLENDAETIELRDGAGVLLDAVVYETNKGGSPATPAQGYGVLPADVLAKVGGGTNSPGLWGNFQTNDSATAGLSLTSMGRYINGLSTNNNGRDWGLRHPTPGASNGPIISLYTPENVDAAAPESAVASLPGSFVPGRVIDPMSVSASNLNA